MAEIINLINATNLNIDVEELRDIINDLPPFDKFSRNKEIIIMPVYGCMEHAKERTLSPTMPAPKKLIFKRNLRNGRWQLHAIE